MEWTDLVGMSQRITNTDELRRRMDSMCMSYTQLQECLIACEGASVRAQVTSGFESLEIMCVTEKAGVCGCAAVLTCVQPLINSCRVWHATSNK